MPCYDRRSGRGVARRAPASGKRIDAREEGTLEAPQNGQKVKVTPGFGFIGSVDEFHGVKNAGDTPAIYFVVKWWPSATPKAEGK